MRDGQSLYPTLPTCPLMLQDQILEHLAPPHLYASFAL